MSLIDFLLFLLIAAAAGGLGKLLAGYFPGGILISILVGYIGAFIGTWIARQFNLPTWLTLNVGGTMFPFLWAVIGAAVLLAVLSLLIRN
jgi:uncharacterized membrane protein YeaQ/YmgE (transglycosylase-associated protein family)